MWPRGKDEETAFGACFVVLVTGVGEVVEAPGSDEDEGLTGIEGGAHDGLLSFGDGGRH